MIDTRLDTVIDGYVTALLWTTSCMGTAEHDNCYGENCDTSLLDLNYGMDDLDAATRAVITADVEDFVTSALEDRPDAFEGMDAAQVGHDFALTRNGHGAGFWDRGLGERGDWLSDLCRPYGESDLYIGDDGQIYC